MTAQKRQFIGSSMQMLHFGHAYKINQERFLVLPFHDCGLGRQSSTAAAAVTGP